MTAEFHLGSQCCVTMTWVHEGSVTALGILERNLMPEKQWMILRISQSSLSTIGVRVLRPLRRHPDGRDLLVDELR